ncbi:MAG TPA: cell division protein FtsQ/DivIB [Candidatus Paceibacterota bacterium]|nr:cell division protein FtsQ/DivIB [Candidatus Paceibacterota bacterium]
MGTIIDLRPGRTPQRAKRTAAPSAPSKRPLPLRARRRRARFAWIVACIVLVAALVYGVHWLSYLPQLNISTVQITGAERVSPELLQQYTDSLLHDGSYHFLSRSNIFLYPAQVLESRIVGDFPAIKSAQVSRDTLFSRTLFVRIDERRPFAQVCEGVNCYLLDDTGYIFSAYDASSTENIANPYIFTGLSASSTNPIGQTFIPGHMPGVIALLTILQQQTGLSPHMVAIADDQDFTVHFAEGFDLKVSFGEDAATVARNLKLLLSTPPLSEKTGQIEYIDLRFGDRAFYKLQGEDQQAE